MMVRRGTAGGGAASPPQPVFPHTATTERCHTQLPPPSPHPPPSQIPPKPLMALAGVRYRKFFGLVAIPLLATFTRYVATEALIAAGGLHAAAAAEAQVDAVARVLTHGDRHGQAKTGGGDEGGEGENPGAAAEGGDKPPQLHVPADDGASSGRRSGTGSGRRGRSPSPRSPASGGGVRQRKVVA
jgi:hypothetical protein